MHLKQKERWKYDHGTTLFKVITIFFAFYFVFKPQNLSLFLNSLLKPILLTAISILGSFKSWFINSNAWIFEFYMENIIRKFFKFCTKIEIYFPFIITMPMHFINFLV